MRPPLVLRRGSASKECPNKFSQLERALLDGTKEYDNKLTAAEANLQLRRVAIMNLKKLGGSGTANVGAIRAHAWRDRKFIRQEVGLVAPTLIVTCGKLAN